MKYLFLQDARLTLFKLNQTNSVQAFSNPSITYRCQIN